MFVILGFSNDKQFCQELFMEGRLWNVTGSYINNFIETWF